MITIQTNFYCDLLQSSAPDRVVVVVLAGVSLGPAPGASAGLVTGATAGVEAVALIRQRPGRVTAETLRPGEGVI